MSSPPAEDPRRPPSEDSRRPPAERSSGEQAPEPSAGKPERSRLGNLLSPLDDPRVAGAVGALLAGGVTGATGGLPWESDEKGGGSEPEKEPQSEAPGDGAVLFRGEFVSVSPEVARELHQDAGAQDPQPVEGWEEGGYPGGGLPA